MADVTSGLSFAGAGNPETVSQTEQPSQQPANGEQQQNGNTPRYITHDEALEMVREAVRSIQSSTDKKISRVEKVLHAAQQQGVTLTQAQAASLVATIESEPEAGSAQQNQPNSRQQQPAQAAGQQGAQQAREDLHPVVLAAFAMMDRAGVQVKPDDPEFSMIDNETEDETDFLASVKKAIAAKRARQQSAGDPARIAHVAGGGAGGAGGGKAAITAQLTELLKKPSQNRAEIKRLSAELKKYN